MTLVASLIRYCTIALPLLVSLLAVAASAWLLASGSASETELAVLRISTQTLISATIVDLVLLVGLLGWNAGVVAPSLADADSEVVSSQRAE